jgi:D-serine deaminase-like pyridoxal phosphate-dependent protein
VFSCSSWPGCDSLASSCHDDDVTLNDLRTPAILIDRPRVLANIDRMQEAADRRGIRMRPHTKTHKSPVVARWQIDRGAIGICCAKLGEAEVFADAGFTDIRVPYPINPVNAPRVLSLLERTRLSFILDHPKVAREWSQAVAGSGRTVDVLIKVDVGFHRCGINPDPATAVAFIKEVAALPALHLQGLLSHAGHAYHATSPEHLRTIAEEEANTLQALKAAAQKEGIQLEELSAGATPTARFSLQQQWLTEYRAGNYVYFDRTQVGLEAATLDDCALTVLATVVSKPAPDRIILDAGSKTLSADAARGFSPLAGHGVIYHPAGAPTGATPDLDLIVERLSEEHATVRVAGGHTSLEPGHRVRIVPNHACVVSNLVDEAWLTDNQQVLEPLPIAARGKIT